MNESFASFIDDIFEFIKSGCKKLNDDTLWYIIPKTNMTKKNRTPFNLFWRSGIELLVLVKTGETLYTYRLRFFKANCPNISLISDYSLP